jgi:hypothetical protein
MLDLEESRTLQNLPGVMRHNFDQCVFGAGSAKPSALLSLASTFWGSREGVATPRSSSIVTDSILGPSPPDRRDADLPWRVLHRRCVRVPRLDESGGRSGHCRARTPDPAPQGRGPSHRASGPDEASRLGDADPSAHLFAGPGSHLFEATAGTRTPRHRHRSWRPSSPTPRAGNITGRRRTTRSYARRSWTRWSASGGPPDIRASRRPRSSWGRPTSHLTAWGSSPKPILKHRQLGTLGGRESTWPWRRANGLSSRSCLASRRTLSPWPAQAGQGPTSCCSGRAHPTPFIRSL